MKILENVHNALSEYRVIGDSEIWAQREGGMKLTNLYFCPWGNVKDEQLGLLDQNSVSLDKLSLLHLSFKQIP